MKRYGFAAAAIVVAVAGCAQMRMPGMGWETLVDGDKGLENFSRVGDANWRAEGGAIVADRDLYWRKDVTAAFVGYALRELRGDDMRETRQRIARYQPA